MQSYQLSVDQVSAVMTLVGPLDPVPEYDGETLVVDDDHAAAIEAVLATAGYALDAARTRTLARLADRRWRAETSGIEVDGIVVATNDRSKTLIYGAAAKASGDAGYTLRFKAASGFITLDAPAIIAISDAVQAHVQACFDREDDLTILIAAADTIEAVEAVDIDTGWPSTVS